MSQNIFDRLDLGDLVKHTKWGTEAYPGLGGNAFEQPLVTYGVVSAIRTHETPILPERKVEVTIQYINDYQSKVHYGNRNSDHLTKLIIIAKGKTNVKESR